MKSQMMKAMRAALSSVALLALAACATKQIRTDFDPEASFAQLRTYDWMNRPMETGGDPRVNSPFLERRIRDAVDGRLAGRGYEKVTSGNPDFRIAYHVVTEERVDVRTIDHFFGYRRRFFTSTVQVREFLEGTLILDVVDTRNNDLIWRGWATGALAHNPKPDMFHKYVNEAVADILDRFPPERISGPGT